MLFSVLVSSCLYLGRKRNKTQRMVYIGRAVYSSEGNSGMPCVLCFMSSGVLFVNVEVDGGTLEKHMLYFVTKKI